MKKLSNQKGASLISFIIVIIVLIFILALVIANYVSNKEEITSSNDENIVVEKNDEENTEEQTEENKVTMSYSIKMSEGHTLPNAKESYTVNSVDDLNNIIKELSINDYQFTFYDDSYFSKGKSLALLYVEVPNPSYDLQLESTELNGDILNVSYSTNIKDTDMDYIEAVSSYIVFVEVPTNPISSIQMNKI